VILCSGGVIHPRDLRFEAAVKNDVEESAQTAPTPADGGLHDNLQSVEHQLVIDALAAGQGSRKRAAEILGISPRTLRYKLARLREAGVAVPDRHQMTVTA